MCVLNRREWTFYLTSTHTLTHTHYHTCVLESISVRAKSELRESRTRLGNLFGVYFRCPPSREIHTYFYHNCSGGRTHTDCVLRCLFLLHKCEPIKHSRETLSSSSVCYANDRQRNRKLTAARKMWARTRVRENECARWFGAGRLLTVWGWLGQPVIWSRSDLIYSKNRAQTT